MPLYEYRCRECRHEFERLVHAGTRPVCPACDSASLQKQLSAFAVGRGGAATAAPLQQACGTFRDPRGAGACSMN